MSVSYPLSQGRQATLECADGLWPFNVVDGEGIKPAMVLHQTQINTVGDRKMVSSKVIDWYRMHLMYTSQQQEVLIYGSGFAAMLQHDGPETCADYKRGPKPFQGQPKFLLFPWAEASHWRLVVAVNPASVLDQANNGKLCCILYLDSCTSIETQAEGKAKLIRDYLNLVWKKQFPDKPQNPFNTDSMPVDSPSVPQQRTNRQNISDCGIYTMLSMFYIVQLRATSPNDWFKCERRGPIFDYLPANATSFRGNAIEFFRRLADNNQPDDVEVLD